MGIPREHILMCEKAEEIQQRWKDESGDFYIVKSDYDISGIRHNIGISTRLKEECIWIPTQGQLQDMVNNLDKWANRPLRLIEDFLECLYNLKNEWEFSMEQLWLVFVMKELYNKVWDGKEWRKS